MEYVVKLEQFEGPLDLLLYLVYKNEMDIFDIPIATITDQFLLYIECALQEGRRLNPEFLLMASTLVHLKSKHLLQGPSQEEVEELRDEITAPLLDYLYFKEATKRLQGLGLLYLDVFPRAGTDHIKEFVEGQERELDVDINGLVQAIRSIIKKVPKDTLLINPPRWTVREKVSQLLGLRERGSVTLEYLAEISSCVEEFVVYFVALLELVFEGLASFLEGDKGIELIFNG